MKKLFPSAWFGGLAIIFLLNFSKISHGLSFEMFASSLPTVLMGIAGYFIMKKVLSPIIDEVYFSNDTLIFINKNKELRVPLCDIKEVKYLEEKPINRVTVSLKEESDFGKEITFLCPAISKNKEIAEVLNRIIKNIG